MANFDVRNRLSKFLDVVFPKRRVVVERLLAERMLENPLCVIDVGGAMGADQRWSTLPQEAVRFAFFEPDARSLTNALSSKHRKVVLPIGLADRRGSRQLHLTKGTFASSLYEPNALLLKDFAVFPWYGRAGEISIEVDTLDACAERAGGWHADFIKVDCEGADLDVLKGGELTLKDAFGVQIEVSFICRNLNAPLQPEMDGWIRNAGFIPHLLIREHWVRTNGIHSANSQPQLAWADAVYFRDRAWVLDRVAKAPSTRQAERIFAAVIAILLVYNAHDYAAEITAAAKDLLPPPLTEAAQNSISNSLIPLVPFAIRGGGATLLALVLAMPLALLGGRGRKVGRDLIAAQTAPLFDALSRAARRGGLDRGCIPDLS